MSPRARDPTDVGHGGLGDDLQLAMALAYLALSLARQAGADEHELTDIQTKLDTIKETRP